MSPDNNENEEPRVGVFVCHCGGNISDVVDVAKVAETIGKDPRVKFSTHFIFMCSDPGQNMVAEKIKELNLNRVIVAACSPKLHELTFRKVVAKSGLNPYYYEHVNIREQDSWVHSHEPEKATEKAIRLIEGAIERLTRQNPLKPGKKKTVPHALVVGGGVAGLTAALDLARRDIPVTLVEKSPFLGGRTAQIDSVYPSGESGKKLVGELIEKVLKNDLITVKTNTEIINAAGSKGDYTVTLKVKPRGVEEKVEGLDKAIEVCPVEVDNEFDYGVTKRKAIYKPYPEAVPELPAIDWNVCTKCGECLKATNNKGINLNAKEKEETIRVGAIVMATGFKPYEPLPGEYGYGEDPNVITLPQLLRIMDNMDPNAKEFVYNGRKIKKIAFIHCVGSRQIEGVHKPREGKELNTYCSRVCCTTTLWAANRLKQKFPDIHMFDLYRDIRTYQFYEDIYEKASRNNVIFVKFPDEEIPQVKIVKDKNGVFKIETTDILLRGKTVAVPADLVVLAVGMEPSPIRDLIEIFSIPYGGGGFLLEGHPKLRPVESSMEGIFLAGTAQAPMSIQEAIIAATAAAGKAANILTKPEIELSPFVATVNLDKCEGTGRCVEECEYNAIELKDADGGKKAVIDPSLCAGCGACVPVCPNNAITLQGYDIDQILAQVEGMIKGVKAE